MTKENRNVVEAACVIIEEKGLKAEVTEVKKLNDVVLTGIVIKTEGSNISPTIYADSIIEKMEEDGIDVTSENIAAGVLAAYNKADKPSDFDVEQVVKYENAKSQITYQLVNRHFCKGILEDLIHRDIDGDLALVYNINVAGMEGATIKVTKQIFSTWNTDDCQVTEEDLFVISKENQKTIHPLVFTDIMGYCDFSPLVGEEEIEEMREMMKQSPMLVVSNRQKVNGAASVFDVQEFMSEDDRYLVIPSSVHEVLLVPYEATMDIDYFCDMIKEVNETQVLPQEVLSDHPYLLTKTDFKSLI